MTRFAVALRWFRRIVYTVAVPVVAVTVALAAVQPGLGWVVIPGLVGGVLTAGVLVLLQGRYRPGALGGNPRPGRPTGIMNIANVHVAGFGGLALVVASGLVALQYQFTTMAMVIGAVGGALIAVALVRYRRRHPTEVLHV